MPGAASLEDAFARAKAAIAEREKKENEIPSDPQASFGNDLHAVLEASPMHIGARGGVITQVLPQGLQPGLPTGVQPVRGGDRQ